MLDGLREFWTPTRPLFRRKRITRYANEQYVLLPGDLLANEGDGWVKVAPGAHVLDVQVDVFRDNLQAVRVAWLAATGQYIFLPTGVSKETMQELELTPPIPVPTWPPPPPPEVKSHPWRPPFGGWW